MPVTSSDSMPGPQSSTRFGTTNGLVGLPPDCAGPCSRPALTIERTGGASSPDEPEIEEGGEQHELNLVRALLVEIAGLFGDPGPPLRQTGDDNPIFDAELVDELAAGLAKHLLPSRNENEVEPGLRSGEFGPI